MKLLALLALLPAALAVPSPMPAPEAYNPFFAPPTALTHSNNPISHADLNSRRHLSAIQDQVVIAGRANHEVRKRSSKVRKVKRQSGSGSGSCVPKGTSTGTGTAVVSSTTTKAAGTTTQGQATVKPTTTTKAQATTKATTTSKAQATTKSLTKASTTSTGPKPAATNFTVDPDGNGPFKGQATYYDTDVGYGSCGVWHKNWEPTVALSRELMDNWPGYNGLNPNNNPICGQKLQLNYQGKTLIASVQDTCPSCTKRWIDVSQGIFEYFADTSVGMLGIDGYTPGFTWQWVDKNTPLTVLPH